MMKQKALVSTRTWVTAALAIFALYAVDASAAERVKGQYATSNARLSQVGDLNAKLSRLCRKGLFKQRKVLRLSIGYVGEDGRGITGIAKPGWNLYDPTGVGDPDYTYHFQNQGYSNCRVYEARTPRPNR